MAPEAIRALAGREARPLAVHVGGGIATRDAYHEQRAAHREALERGTAGAPERLALPVVTVPAASIVVAEDGPNYRPVVKSKGIKQEKQARRRATATAAAGVRRWSRRWRVSRRWWARSRKTRTSRRRRTTSAPRGSGARGARARRYAWLSVSRQRSRGRQRRQARRPRRCSIRTGTA